MPQYHWMHPLLCCALLVLIGVRPLRAQGSEVVRGRVLDDSRQNVADAEVTITGGQTGQMQIAHTDRKGNFTALFADPQGTYRIAIRKIGFGPVTVFAQLNGLATVITVPEVILKALPVPLPPVTGTGMKVIPSKSGNAPSIGSSEQNLLMSTLFSLDPSDLFGLAAQLPGVFTTDSGFSALGASSSQNAVLVDGSSFAGSDLPRDAIATAKLSTVSYDPSRGLFSGAQMIVTTRRGTPYFLATVRTQLIDPRLAWSDPLSATEVPRTPSVSGFVGGTLFRKRLPIFLAFDGSDRRSITRSLLAPRPALLTQLGVLQDTVAAMTSTLNALGIPLTAPGAPRESSNQRGSATLRIDYQPVSQTTITLNAYGSWNRVRGTGVSQVGFPSSSGERSSSMLRLGLNASGYFGGFLDELRIGVTPSRADAAPHLALPGGSVQVGTQLEDGRTGATWLRFGGSTAGTTATRSTTWDLSNELSWVPEGSHHHLKLTQELHAISNRLTEASNPAGSFSYQTLADLAANQPAGFSRTLHSIERSSNTTTLSFSLGDTWRAIPGIIDFQGGVRYDRSHFGTQPGFNAEIEETFGLRTDHVPDDGGFSPRLGFSWTPKARRGAAPLVGPGQTIVLPGGGGLGARGGRDDTGLGLLPTAANKLTITGGFGALRGLIQPNRISSLVDATGLPGTTRYLSCVGDATPVADWSLNGTAPESCLDGQAPVGFGSQHPNVTVLDPSFRAPISWRANLQLWNLRVHRWTVMPTAVYSVGVNNPSRLDLNLNRTPRFTLPDEGDRPVFAPVTNIVSATGLFAPGGSRIDPAFGTVGNTVSDLSYRAGQFNIILVPPAPLFGSIPVAATYSLNVQRAEQRGLTGATGADPFTKEWVAGQQPLHQFRFTASGLKLWWFTAVTRLDITSGRPYTPTVGNDVNGDGMANDRAFITNPAISTDPLLASQLTSLLERTTGSARRCLESQMGRLARVNSCRTAWQARLDLGVNFTPPTSLGLGNRLKFTTAMFNAGGALVRLLGLTNTPLGQSQVSTNVDGRLLYVTGFDPATQRFSYRVNQLFGQPPGAGSSLHHFPPFQLQLGVEYKLGGPPPAQRANSLGLMPNGPDKTITTEDAQLALRRTVQDPMSRILTRRDSLALSAEQIAQLEGISAEFMRQADSLLMPLVNYVVSRGTKLVDTDLTPRLDALKAPMATLMNDSRKRADALLTPEQLAKLRPQP